MVAMLDELSAIPVVAPLVVREIHYRLLMTLHYLAGPESRLKTRPD